MEESLYCASPSFLWSCKARNKQFSEMSTQEISAPPTDTINITIIHVSIKSWCPLTMILCTQSGVLEEQLFPETYSYIFSTRPLKKVEMILDRSLLITRCVIKLWQHSEAHLTFSMKTGQGAGPNLVSWVLCTFCLVLYCLVYR
jgi:hypothetical protein